MLLNNYTTFNLEGDDDVKEPPAEPGMDEEEETDMPPKKDDTEEGEDNM